MNKFFTFLIISLFISMSLQAQTFFSSPDEANRFDKNDFALISDDVPQNIETDATVSVGAYYVDQVWWSLESGEIETGSLLDWDIAFSTGETAAIRINGGKGNVLYHVVGSDQFTYEEFAPDDTIGLAADQNGEIFRRWDNADTNWVYGAFNLGKDGYSTGGDYGWGMLDVGTHVTSGTTMFLVKLLDGSFKKIFIESLSFGEYSFRFADLDGSNEIEASVKKADNPNRNFIYYSMENDEVLDMGADKSQWDFIFMKYITQINMGQMSVPYAVTGALQNDGVWVAELPDSDYDNLPVPQNEEFSYLINTVGSDWKSYDLNNSQWVLKQNLSYVIRSKTDQNLYKLQFSGFGGSSSGDINFKYELLQANNVMQDGRSVAEFKVYPNEIESGESLNFILSSEEIGSIAKISIFDMAGNEIINLNEQMNSNLITIPSGKLNIAAGMYFAVCEVNGGIALEKIIVR